MLRALLSPLLVILTVLCIPSIEQFLLFLPLFFSLSIGLVNYSKLKVNLKALGIFITIIQSYAVFLGLGIVLFFLDEFLQESFLESSFLGIILVTFGGYLGAILLFYFFSFTFKIDNKRFSYIVITICYAFIILIMQIFSKNEFLQFGVEKFASFLISWIIFMSFGFSLALNRFEVMSFIEKK